jgi:hypothetical protein
MIDIIQAISDDIGLCIAEHYSDIGVMTDLKRKFKQTEIHQYADYFIRIDLAAIEELGEERNDHEKRLKELRRARQDRASDGNGDQISERAGVYVDASVWNPKPGQVHRGVQGRGVDNDFGLHEERENPLGSNPDGGIHQTELLPSMVQLRGADETIFKTISDSPPSFPAAGIEGERDGLDRGPDR